MKAKKKSKLWRRILLGLIIFGIFLFTGKISLHEKIHIQTGEGVYKIFDKLGTIDQFRIKRYVKRKNIDFSKLEIGNYTFSGNYSKTEFVQKILDGSEKDYIRLTILEGRSIYDIDEALARKNYITPGDYIAYVTNRENIVTLQNTYSFLLPSTLNLSPITLEGFLYPDTYHVDKNRPLIPQLVSKQLQTFQSRVRSKLDNPTDFYKTTILASVVEKEERNPANKATVAGIFFKRLEIWMRIDADITLCYGLKTSYTSCTPSLIARSISDKKNIYNTRVHGGIPPTPICNPSRESFNAVINPQNSDYLYYLHDMKGNIHYGRTLEEHNANKKKYLN